MNQIQTIILAGGEGTRLHSNRPKALTTVGNRPIIDHQLKLLLGQGINHISIALGSQQEPFVQHFGIPVQNPDHKPRYQPLKWGNDTLYLRLLLTGDYSDTAGRLGRLSALIDEPFLLSWCDGLWDIDLNEMLNLHARNKLLATLLAVHPPGRFGLLELQANKVVKFREKPEAVDEWINGGLFVLEPAVLHRISGDDCSFEYDILPGLARDGQLQAWRHEGFWHCMDTPADRHALDQFIRNGQSI